MQGRTAMRGNFEQGETQVIKFWKHCVTHCSIWVLHDVILEGHCAKGKKKSTNLGHTEK